MISILYLLIGFETTVLREISILKLKVNTIMDKLDSMINYMNSRESQEKTDHRLEKNLKSLIPVKTFLELQKLEDLLKDENISSQKVRTSVNVLIFHF